MKNKRGFTIIEIVSVLVIIALIATMAIAGINGARGRIDNKAYNSKVKLIEQAASLFAKENSEKFKEEFGACTQTSGNCDCTGETCLYKFNTTVQELIELGYYDAEMSNKCLVENPKDKDKCFDKEPIEIIIDAEDEVIESHFGEEFDPYDDIENGSSMCKLEVEGTEGTNGWYVGNTNKLKLVFKIDEDNVARYGMSREINVTYNNTREIPLSSTTGVTYYGFVKDKDGNEGSCHIKNIKVDATNPTDPNVEFDNNFNVVFNGSTDTYSERVKYSYTVGSDNPVIGTKYRVPSNMPEASLQVYAFDYAGNKSNTINKTLSVSNPQNGTITQAYTYYCDEGYTCDSTPCKSDSKCIKNEFQPPKETKKYKCSLNDKVYATYQAAEDDCLLHESGTVTSSSYYECPDGYVSEDEPIQSNSKCRKVIATAQPNPTMLYDCYINGNYVESYNSREEANQKCVKEVPGTFTQENVKSCPSGYSCVDDSCSACTKTTSANLITATKYTCSLHPNTFYDTQRTAQNNCTDVQTSTNSYNYISYCSETGRYNYYFGDETKTGTALTSCTSNSISCNESNYGKKNTRCTSYYKYVGTGYCHDSNTNKKYKVTVGRYDTYEQCNYEVHYVYQCDVISEFFEQPLCSKTKFYSKWEKTCYRTPVKTYGPYYCNQSGCPGSCPSGYTRTTSRSGCYNSNIEGNSCTSNHTCSANTTTTCTKTGTVGTTEAYSCPSGYTCSNNCASPASTCTKVETTSSVNQTKYKCTRTGVLYDTSAEAQANCKDLEPGTVVDRQAYRCSEGYTCSDMSNCNSSSVCNKFDVQNPNKSYKYYCSLTETFYNGFLVAVSNCSRDTVGEILDYYVYTCNTGFICSTPCDYNGMCKKTDIKATKYDKNYYCSLNLDEQYDNVNAAQLACTNNCGRGKYNFNNGKCYTLE